MGILSYFAVLSTQTHYKNQVICLIKLKIDNAKNVLQNISECGETTSRKVMFTNIHIKKYKIDLKIKMKNTKKTKFH